MKTKLILFSLAIFSYTFLFAQESNSVKNPSKTNAEMGVSSDFQFMSFTIYNINSGADVEQLMAELNQNENFEKVEISEHFQFKGFVKKDFRNQLNLFFNERGYKTSMPSSKPLSQNEGSIRVLIPEDMKPVYKETGHPEKDKKRYTEAKRKLLEEHPEYIQQ